MKIQTCTTCGRQFWVFHNCPLGDQSMALRDKRVLPTSEVVTPCQDNDLVSKITNEIIKGKR